jgi:hypothetical protein
MAIVEGLIKPWAKNQSKESAAQVFKQSVKGTDLAKKQAVETHLSKINGKLNGNGNGNGLRNGLEETTVDLNYKPSDNFVKADREKRINTSPVYTFNNWQTNKPTKLTDITEWNSEFDVNTKEHLLDFGKAVKYIFPGKVGEENFYDFGEIHKLYESLGYSRTKNGIKYNVQLGKGSYGIKNKYAGGPVVGTKQTELRRANQRKSGKKRADRIVANGYSSQADIDHFEDLKSQVSEGNKRIFEETGIKPKGTTGFVLEHNILQSSRYWDVHTSSKNSDISNTFVWNNPRFVNYKGTVEEHLKKIPGEPFAVKMNGTLDKMEIIHIDTNKVIGEIELGDDYKSIFKALTADFA